MKEKKEKVSQWIKEHKKEIIFWSGFGLTTIIAVILNNKRVALLEISDINDSSQETYQEEHNSLKDESFCDNSFEEGDITIDISEELSSRRWEVNKHIRNLKDGQLASPEKIATATANGFDLIPGQTWVDSYEKGGMVA